MTVSVTIEQAQKIVDTHDLREWYDLGRALKLRASGKSWADIAYPLNVSLATAKRWAAKAATESEAR